MEQEFSFRYGETTCQTTKRECLNKAYYLLGEEYLCGVHARNKEERIELPKIPKEEKDREFGEKQKAEKREIRKQKKKNNEKGRKGKLRLYRMSMMKPVESKPGFLNVFPNYRHQNRRDGFGCSSLSPMSLGPVDHGQPGLPKAKNIENFFQGSKVFPSEADKEGNPTEEFYKTQRNAFRDPVPHRHKETADGKGQKKNIPLYFLWIEKDGIMNKLGYIQSRQFYCNFFERLASEQEDFKELLRLHEEGTNLQICGYDAYAFEDGQSIEENYLDASRPFGHEKVVYTMLKLWDTPEKFPWRLHKTFEF